MRHLKRQKVPKSWPIPRKGKTFVVKPASNLENGIPALVVLRDILKVAQTRKEVKKAIYNKTILVNTKPLQDEKRSILLFDTITLVPSKKSYRLELSGTGKFDVKEIKESETGTKVSKVVNKKVLRGKKVQLNLLDGSNLISDVNCKVNDSVVIDLKNKKVSKCLSMKEKAEVLVFAGKHAGETGKIEELDLNSKMAKVNEGKGVANVLIKQIMVTA